ncbi:MAG: hypothetical protein KAS73_04595 [Candidatus Sabulitectum sp.]|nr:hypothetical protein [Candidatus Sabulitectum sp.]
MKWTTLKKVLAEAVRRISVSAVSLFLWISIVVGFFTGLTDVTQYFRYSKGFPDHSFTMNLLAGIAALLMLVFSVVAIVKLRKNSRGMVQISIAVSTAMGFVPAYLPRAAIGSAIRQDLFVYLGGLGIMTLFFLFLSDSSPDTPDNTP